MLQKDKGNFEPGISNTMKLFLRRTIVRSEFMQLLPKRGIEDSY